MQSRQFFAAVMLGAMLLPSLASAQVVQTYFYHNGSGKESFDDNHKKIDVISPQVYYIDEDFDLEKSKDSGILRKARRERVRIVPLVYQEGFSRELMSRILSDDDAQEEIIEDLIDEADDRNYAGWQFDFEYISSADRDRYADFVRMASEEFEDAGLELSVAVVPRTSPYDKNGIQDLTAAYDYEELGESADYLVAMAYNDPNSVGPTGSLPYQRAVLDYMTTLVPEEKLSLGIPLYCSKWRITPSGYTQYGELPHSYTEEEVEDSKLLLKGYLQGLESEYYAYIVPSGNLYLTWCDGVEGFAAKMDLAREYGLRGVSMWALGQEDYGIWGRL